MIVMATFSSSNITSSANDFSSSYFLDRFASSWKMRTWKSDDTNQLVERLCCCECDDKDIMTVTQQLGRFPRGMIAVANKCSCGLPIAVATRPTLPDGTPFPTLFYLTEPAATKAISRFEAEGFMRLLQDLLAKDAHIRDAYVEAHHIYRSLRHTLALRLNDDDQRIAQVSAGGMPTRVKCLHALVAYSLVVGPGVNPIGDCAISLMKHLQNESTIGSANLVDQTENSQKEYAVLGNFEQCLWHGTHDLLHKESR